MNKLPKQWKHWCKLAGLHPRKGTDRKDQWWYLQGHGHEWRVNDKRMFQCGDRIVDFDRWALCDIKELPVPTTRDEFLKAVEDLVILHSLSH